MGGTIPRRHYIDIYTTGRGFVRVRKAGPHSVEGRLADRTSKPIVFTTYNRCDASQLEILEVIHLAHRPSLWFDIFGTSVLPIHFMADVTFLLNMAMHFPRKSVHLMTVRKREKILQN